MKAKVMPDGRMSLPADLRRRHGLGDGGEVIVEDLGDAIVPRTLDQVVARAQALSRRLVGDKPGHDGGRREEDGRSNIQMVEPRGMPRQSAGDRM